MGRRMYKPRGACFGVSIPIPTTGDVVLVARALEGLAGGVLALLVLSVCCSVLGGSGGNDGVTVRSPYAEDIGGDTVDAQ